MTTGSDLNRVLWQERAAGDASRAWESLTTEPEGLREEMSEDGLWLRPPGAADDRVVLAIHGGGFVSGSIATHRRMFGHLALASGLATLVVDYGLVPDFVYPSQIEQVSAIYRRLTGRLVAGRRQAAGQQPAEQHEVGGQQVAGRRPTGRRVALVGDSCGGTLALEVALREDVPETLVLFSPWVDFETSGASYETGSDPFFTPELVRGLAKQYLAGATPGDLDLAALPPTYVQVGGEEALLDDARMLAARSAAVELDVFPGQLHTFQMAAGNSPVADEAIRKAGSWLRRTMAS
ncbi:alpha/beta hydrolase fold domain-containing protein [Actinoplanes sp. Pm04-4]|uniref:Alpha/beta hydrolase fold domain-containing protein n=1 Tax=Paractinoplanes pyxinae TaxID=2997416 RepID=A0ABT4B5D0_9ACTN|nr:alpha/beta hydrolase fold domain-containing protein [Actinoplanes pyxinae]MCY1140818.1 alpha/beta hydrolase fold domain-containing protein [Actinoplanes pyxinae]